MIEITTLPHVLAGINSTTICLLIAGYVFIRNQDKARHRLCMLGAVAMAVLFLIVYVYYHANAGLAKFGGEGAVRPIYFTILIAHIIGAMVLLPMVPVTLVRALRERFDAHKKLAKWTLPLWLYVSVSGVFVYIMAIHIYPNTGG